MQHERQSKKRAATNTITNMEAKRINKAIQSLDLAVVDAYLQHPRYDGLGFEFCRASLNDWIQYVVSSRQVISSGAMEWRDGKIYILALPNELHQDLVKKIDLAFADATGTRDRHLRQHGASNVQGLNQHLPDCSFGPSGLVSGALLPKELTWREFHTLKVVVPVSSGWPWLRRKAEEWREIPGLQYILSIHVSRTGSVREYRVDSIVSGAFTTPYTRPVLVTNPSVIRFNSRRLLGLPHRSRLLVGFSAPVVEVDLFRVLEDAFHP